MPRPILLLWLLFLLWVPLFSGGPLLSGLRAQPPLLNSESEPQANEVSRPATDLYGDPLPAGAIARLGTLNLRAVGAKTALSSDGKTIITVSSGMHVKVWNAETGKLRDESQLPVMDSRDNLSRKTFLSPDGQRVAYREGNSPLEIWDLAKRQRLDQLVVPQMEDSRGAVFSPDGKLLAVKMKALHLWRIGTGENQILKGDQKAVTGAAFSPDGKLVATADGASVICWSTANGQQIWHADGSADVLAFPPDGKTLIGAPGFHRGTWQCWDAVSGKPDTSRKLPEGAYCVGLALAPDNWTVAFSFSGSVQGVDPRVRAWDMRTGTLVAFLPTTDSIVAFAPDSKSILTNDGTLQRWELPTGRPLFPDSNANGHRREVFKVIYSRDGKLLASSAEDGTIRLWDVATTKVLHVMRSSREHSCTNLAFTSDAKRLLSADTDGDLHIWDTAAGKELRRIALPDDEVNKGIKNVFSLQVTPNDQTAVLHCSDSTGRVSLFL